jgi:DNA-directed RNA polymerase subunit D
MEVKVKNKTKTSLVLYVKGADVWYLNALRRIIMSEVATLAIEDVEIRKNSSILYDEIIAHRLGLIPIKTDLKSYNLPDQCQCKGKGCAKCTLKLTLKVAGPKTVYASDLKSKDPKCKPVYPEMPIVKLLAGQELQVVATAVMGKGKDHTKWSPGLAYYKNFPHIELPKKIENPEMLAKKHPKILEVKNGKLNLKKDAELFDISESLEKDSNGAIKVSKKDDYLFFVESWGQLDPKEIIVEAVKNYEKQLEEFKKIIKKA